MRLSEADLRRAGYAVFGRDQYFVNSCGHGQAAYRQTQAIMERAQSGDGVPLGPADS